MIRLMRVCMLRIGTDARRAEAEQGECVERAAQALEPLQLPLLGGTSSLLLCSILACCNPRRRGRTRRRQQIFKVSYACPSCRVLLLPSALRQISKDTSKQQRAFVELEESSCCL
ncbi:unnamed protein product [Urochloa humidicola]